jgi:hypothetical protein
LIEPDNAARIGLFRWAEPFRKSRSQNEQKFFASFFKKEDFVSCLVITSGARLAG